MPVLFVAQLAVAVVGAVLAVGAAVLVLGAYAPRLPHVGPLGSLILSLTGPWLIVVSLISLALILAGSPDRGPITMFFAALSTLTLIAAGAANLQMLGAAHRAGVAVNFGSTFNLRAVTRPGVVDATEQYALDGQNPLTVQVYRPRTRTNPAPILVYVHGGGWVGQNNEIRAVDMRWFADQGYLVISVGYALSTDDQHRWNDVTAQIGCALAWVATNSERFGGDASRLSLIGDSAGGNLVINAGYMANQGTLRSSCDGMVPRVGAVIAIYPGVDLVNIHDNPDLNRAGSKFTRSYIGGSPIEYPDRYTAVASATHIHAAAPPTFLLIGENDHLVPPQPSYAFADQAGAAGIEVELIRFPFGQHGFDLFEGSVGNQIFRHGGHRFLQRHGQAPNPT